jgi:Tfp pilus assembly protein PilO
MASINIAGREIPAFAITAVLAVLGIAYAADASYFGYVVTSETISAALDKVAAQEAGIEDKKRQAQELKARTKEIDTIKAETVALDKSITLLKAKIPGEAQVPVLLYDIERMAKASDGNLKSFEPGELKPYGSAPGSAPVPTPPPAPTPAPPKPKPVEKEGGGGAEGAAAPASGAPAGGAPAPAPVAAAPARPATADIMELPVTVHAEATYPQVIKFLDQLGTYERKLNVSNLQLTPLGGASASASDPNKQAIVFKNMLNVEFTLTAYVLRKSGGQP